MERFLIDFTMGGVAGAIAKSFTAPSDRIKTAMQYQKVNKAIRSGEEPPYAGIIDCADRIYKKEGLLGFWKGHLWKCLRYFPTQMINLATKDTFKKLFPKYHPKTEFGKFVTANLLSGAMAASATLAIFYPIDSADLGFVADTSRRYDGRLDFFKKARVKGGLGLLYTGFGISIGGILLYRAFQLCCFDMIVSLNPWKGNKGVLGTVAAICTSQVAIQIGALVSYPFDTIRRRLQADAFSAIADDKELCYSGAVDCAMKIADEEGVAGFYDTYWLSVYMSVCNTVVMILYGKAKRAALG